MAAAICHRCCNDWEPGAGSLKAVRGPQRAHTKELVSLRLSAEVIEPFKATGPGWQTRIDSTLLESIKKRP